MSSRDRYLQMHRVLLLSALVAAAACEDPDGCITEKERVLPSPSGDRRATVFAGPCAGTAPAVLVDFVRAGGGSGVFAAEDSVVDLSVRWIGEDTLEIGYPSSTRVVKRTEFAQYGPERVVVRYVTQADSGR